MLTVSTFQGNHTTIERRARGGPQCRRIDSKSAHLLLASPGSERPRTCVRNLSLRIKHLRLSLDCTLKATGVVEPGADPYRRLSLRVNRVRDMYLLKRN